MASGSGKVPEESADKKTIKPPIVKIQHLWHSSCPYQSADWDVASYGLVAKNRVKLDIANLFHEPLPGVFLSPDDQDITKMHAMIIGNYDTPYEGGFFHFFIRVGPNYPFNPPRVSSMTSFRFGHKVRFNPNLYVNGKVCLSILGTWAGPAWSAASNVGSLLLSLQSLLSGKALRNEPGHESLKDSDARVVAYDQFVRHETLRVAVLATLGQRGNSEVPDHIMACMVEQFLENYADYVQTCEDNKARDGKSVTIALVGEFKPDFKQLLVKLKGMHEELAKEYPDILLRVNKRESESAGLNAAAASTSSEGRSAAGSSKKAKLASAENKKLPKVCQKPSATGDAMMREYNFSMPSAALDTTDTAFVMSHEDSDAELSPYEEEDDGEE